jgi:hypothetical protein
MMQQTPEPPQQTIHSGSSQPPDKNARNMANFVPSLCDGMTTRFSEVYTLRPFHAVETAASES